MDRSERPDFAPRRALLAGPGFLSPARLAQLRQYLPRRLATAPPGSEPAKRVDAFLAAAVGAAHIAHALRPRAAPAELARELRALAMAAGGLMRCLHGLSGDAVSAFGAYYDELALARPARLSELGASMVRPEGRFLSTVWELLADVETTATFALGHVAQPSRHLKVSESATRGLVASVARAWRAHAGRWPGHSKSAWFPGFMRELVRGEPFRGRCGPELVRSVLADLRATDPDPPV